MKRGMQSSFSQKCSRLWNYVVNVTHGILNCHLKPKSINMPICQISHIHLLQCQMFQTDVFSFFQMFQTHVVSFFFQMPLANLQQLKPRTFPQWLAVENMFLNHFHRWRPAHQGIRSELWEAYGNYMRDGRYTREVMGGTLERWWEVCESYMGGTWESYIGGTLERWWEVHERGVWEVHFRGDGRYVTSILGVHERGEWEVHDKRLCEVHERYMGGILERCMGGVWGVRRRYRLRCTGLGVTCRLSWNSEG